MAAWNGTSAIAGKITAVSQEIGVAFGGAAATAPGSVECEGTAGTFTSAISLQGATFKDADGNSLSFSKTMPQPGDYVSGATGSVTVYRARAEHS
jgi:hypothetical protein